MSIVSSLKLTASMVVGCLVDHIYIYMYISWFFVTGRDQMYGRGGDSNAEASEIGGPMVAEKFKAPKG